MMRHHHSFFTDRRHRVRAVLLAMVLMPGLLFSQGAAPSSVVVRKTTLKWTLTPTHTLGRYWGFDEFTTPTDPKALPRKYSTLTWNGTMEEMNDGTAPGSFPAGGKSVFGGSAVINGPRLQNNLTRVSFVNIGSADAGSGDFPYTVVFFPGGGCAELHNVQSVFIATQGIPGLNFPPIYSAYRDMPIGRIDTNVRTNLVHTITGAMQFDWTTLALPCNLLAAHEGSNVFPNTGPVTETLTGLVTTAMPVSPDDSFSPAPNPPVDPRGGDLAASLDWRYDNRASRDFGAPAPVLTDGLKSDFAAVFTLECAQAKAVQAWITVNIWKDGDTTSVQKIIAQTCPKDPSPDGTLTVKGTLDLAIILDSHDPQVLAGWHVALAHVALDLDPATCLSCADSVEAGSTAGLLDSINWRMNLGLLPGGTPAGYLRLLAETFSPALFAPGALFYSAPAYPTADSVAIRRADGSLRQLRTGTGLFDIVSAAEDSSLPAACFEIRFFNQAGSTPSAADPTLLIPAGAAIHITRFSDPDGNGNRMRIARYITSVNQAFDVVEYSYVSATNTWSLTEQGLRRTDKMTTPTASNEFDLTTSVWDVSQSSPVLVRKVKEHFHDYPQEGTVIRLRTSEIKDPDGVALTSTWTYDPALLQQTSYRSYTGAWERDQDTAQNTGQITLLHSTETPFANTAFGETTGVTRVIETVVGDGGTTTRDRLSDTETVTSRSRETAPLSGQLLDVYTQGHRQNVSAGGTIARWEVTKSLANGRFAGQNVYRLDVAGVLETSDYQFNAATGRTTQITERGAPNSDNTAVVDGTREITITNADGHLASRSSLDIATGIVLGSEIMLAYDPQGRPVQIGYLDGSVEMSSYSVCCGLLQSTSRNFIATSYSYDVLKRKISETTAGITTLYDYDAVDRIVRVRRRGSDNSEIVISRTAYDLAGRLVATTTALNASTAYAEFYNFDGTVTRTTTAPDGSTQIDATNADGSPASRGGTRASPVNWQYTIESDPITKTKWSVVTERKAPAGTPATEFIKTYRDGFGRTVRVQYADGAAETWNYNAAEQLVARSDLDGVTTLYGYNAKGEQDTLALDLNSNGRIDFDGTDRITRTTRSAANAHNSPLVRTTTTVWTTEGSAGMQDVSVSETATNGLLAWQTASGVTTQSQVVYSADGSRIETATGPDGTQSVSTYQQNRLASVVTTNPALGQLSAVTYAYDPHGRISSMADARNGATTYTYYDDDQVHTVTTPDPDSTRTGPGYDPQTTTYAYDVMGRQNLVTQSDGGVVNTTYYLTGQVKRTWGTRTYPVEYAYDSQSRVATMTTWQNFAGDTGRAVTTWNYDPQRGWLSSKVYADGGRVSYAYTPAGRLRARAWARSSQVPTTYTYNSAGEVAAINYGDATPGVAFAYDRLGRLSSRTDAAGVCTYSYLGVTSLVTGEAFTGGLLDGQAVARGYDPLLRLTNLAAAGAPATGYQYDAASRLSRVISGSNISTYTYAANSTLVQSLAFANGPTTRLTTTKSYDFLNRLSAINNTPSSQPSALNYAYTYDAANQRTRITHADGTAWGYAYDALGQVTSGAKFLADGTPALGSSYAYTYDDIGNRKTTTTNGRGAQYTANVLNQYTQRTVSGAVDVLGTADAAATVSVNGATPQRQGETFYQTLPASNAAAAQSLTVAVTGARAAAGPGGADVNVGQTRVAFVPKTPEILSYDADGNLLTDGRWSYTWDAENRLVACETQPAAVTAGAPKQKLTFAYDGLGRRIQKKVYTWNAAGTTYQLASDTRFVYDGWNLLAELNLSGTVATVRCGYTWGADLSGSLQGAGGVGGLLFRTDSAATYAYAYDGNGNVSGLVNATDGTLSAKYDYNAFGETVEISGPAAAANPFRFSTKFADIETGLVYYGLRYYQPQTGRWLSRDPIEELGFNRLTQGDSDDDSNGLQGDTNLYGFVANNPTNAIDGLGLFLAAIDGTDSEKSVRFDAKSQLFNSHVRNFYDAYSGPGGKQYWKGPNLFGGGVAGTVDEAYQRISQALKANPGEEINLVGHSRGGLIAILVAKKLKKENPCAKVHFLGLYDAVDRYLFANAGTIPDNVEYVAHARRNPAVHSRDSFGNTGTSGGQEYVQQFFWVTHSGAGGDPWGGPHPKVHGKPTITKEQDEEGSRQVGNWMRGQFR